MFALALTLSTIDGWPSSAGWTGLGLVATLLGCVLGAASVWLTLLIFRWTSRDDVTRHGELRERLVEQAELLAQQKDALEVMGTLVRELRPPVPDLGAEMARLSPEERRELSSLLRPEEQVVRISRSGSGKGNHPWQAFTTKGRVIQVYTGGRGGGVHARALD